MSWSNEVVLEFVELYRNEQILWDPKHTSYKNRNEANEAWRRIQSSLSINCSIVDLKKKKESLMSSFRLHFNKKKKFPESYRPTWFAYSLMESFLGGKYECDSSTIMEQEFFDHADYAQPCASTPASRSLTSIGTGRTNPGRHYKSQKHISPLVKKEEIAYTKPNSEQGNFDEYDLYGQLLAKKLRKLDERQRDVAMHEIDNIMFRAKMQSTTGQRDSSSPTPRKTNSPIFIVTQSHSQFEDENMSYQEHMQPPAPS